VRTAGSQAGPSGGTACRLLCGAHGVPSAMRGHGRAPGGKAGNCSLLERNVSGTSFHAISCCHLSISYYLINKWNLHVRSQSLKILTLIEKNKKIKLPTTGIMIKIDTKYPYI